MLGEFVTRVLVLVLGYAYPAFECFKLMEKSKIDVEQLMFWCEYWVIVAIITIFERFFDIFVSWLPFYGETKLAFFIYLWHPKTRGTRWVYEAFLRPLVTRHEPDIEQKLQSYRARAADLLLFYIKNFTEQGQSLFLEMLHYLTAGASNSRSKKNKRPGSSGSDDPLAIRRSGNDKEDFSYSPEIEEAFRAAQECRAKSVQGEFISEPVMAIKVAATLEQLAQLEGPRDLMALPKRNYTLQGRVWLADSKRHRCCRLTSSPPDKSNQPLKYFSATRPRMGLTATQLQYEIK